MNPFRSRFTCLHAIFCLAATVATAAEIKVDSLNDAGAGSLRNAIAGASDGDVVLLRAEGTVVFQSPITVNRSITIEGQEGPLAHSLSGAGSTQLFIIPPGKSVTIARLTLEAGDSTGDGGAISSEGELTLLSVRAIGSSATGSGGAVYQSGGSLSIDRSDFQDNSSGLDGGAVFVDGAAATVTSSGFSGNSATSAGGALAVSTTGLGMSVRSSTFSGNAASSGGGLALLQGAVSAVNLTLINNQPDHVHAGAGTSITVANTIIEGPGGSLPGMTGSVIDDGNNFSGPFEALGLGSFADYGGVSWTYVLEPGSPAIDGGDNAKLEDSDRDQRGLSRFSDGYGDDGGDVADIGAFEIQHYKVSALQIRGKKKEKN